MILIIIENDSSINNSSDHLGIIKEYPASIFFSLVSPEERMRVGVGIAKVKTNIFIKYCVY